MADTKTSNELQVRRYRINPVEIIILLTIGGVFLNSVYSLFYDNHGFHPTALKDMAANPVSEGSRLPAATSSKLLSADIGCKDNPEHSTSAAKVKLSGPLCGAEGAANDPLVRVSVLNESNHFSATVFPDTVSSRFSTDFIPLMTGRNPIQLEFSYQSGKTLTTGVIFSKF